jgi:hypothetical protein
MSEKPLAERLQVKSPRRLALHSAPPPVAAMLAGTATATLTEAEVVLLFAANRAALNAVFATILPTLRAGAIIWIAYPKLTSKLAGDLNRDIIHAISPAHGLDAVAQIAIDIDWSAMRFKRIG